MQTSLATFKKNGHQQTSLRLNRTCISSLTTSTLSSTLPIERHADIADAINISTYCCFCFLQKA